ncbi:MAG: TonB family protein [Rhodocyclaceae bacterium]|nr:TonB family protein [Rhodocyclaceae bacterium]
MRNRRLLFALSASLALHLALLGFGLPQGKVGLPSTAISARILPPAQVRPAEPVLKDTLADEASGRPATPPTPTEAKGRRPAPRTPEAAAQRKLSEVLFYPPEAVARGLEGEVRLLLTLDGDGAIRDAQVAAGSGHRILDEAAIKAAFAMGSLPEAEAREVILPVVFRLR